MHALNDQISQSQSVGMLLIPRSQSKLETIDEKED